MKSLLLSATVLMGLSAPAWADINNIRIDASSNGGKVTTLSISQDAGNLGNQVSGNSAGTTALPIAGPWDTVSVNQQGGTNKFYGSVKASGGSVAAALTASYTGGNNTHSLTIGASTPPTDPAVNITVVNTVGGTNAITDALDGSSLTYNLALTGTGNTLANSVSASGAVTLNHGNGSDGYGITGDNNSVTNTVSGVTSFTHTLTIAGDGNSVTNIASGGGDKTITQSIASDSNTVAMTLDAAGTQSASLTVDSGSKVNYTLLASAVGGAQNINLSNVIGAGNTAAVINVTQTAAASNATANVTVSGGSFTMGSSLGGGAGMVVYQSSPGAYTSAVVAAGSNGYTVNIVQ